MSIESITQEVIQELISAEAKFKPFNSSHEGYAVILEELDELWDVVKLNPKKIPFPSGLVKRYTFPPGLVIESRSFDDAKYISSFTEEFDNVVRSWQEAERNKMLRAEAIQVAAMAIRFIKCICDKEKDGKATS